MYQIYLDTFENYEMLSKVFQLVSLIFYFMSSCYEWLKCAAKRRSPCDFTCMYVFNM